MEFKVGDFVGFEHVSARKHGKTHRRGDIVEIKGNKAVVDCSGDKLTAHSRII